MGTLSREIIDDARISMHQTKVPASVTLAQGIDESQWFTKEPVGSNNYFGIKQFNLALPHIMAPTHEIINGINKIVMQPFAHYYSVVDCFIAHAKLFVNDVRYKKAMENVNNPLAFCDALEGVYATDPNYSKKLKNLILEEKLLQYDTV